jgi:hypothetical protein
MLSNPERLAKYLIINYKLRQPRKTIIEMLDKYSTSNIEDKKIINGVFEILFGLSIESLDTISQSLNIDSIDSIDSKDILYDTINKLNSTISNLESEIEELRDSYWNLNQLIIKQKK